MTDFLRRLAERAAGAAPGVRPALPPRFAPAAAPLPVAEPAWEEPPAAVEAEAPRPTAPRPAVPSREEARPVAPSPPRTEAPLDASVVARSETLPASLDRAPSSVAPRIAPPLVEHDDAPVAPARPSAPPEQHVAAAAQPRTDVPASASPPRSTAPPALVAPPPTTLSVSAEVRPEASPAVRPALAVPTRRAASPLSAEPEDGGARPGTAPGTAGRGGAEPSAPPSAAYAPGSVRVAGRSAEPAGPPVIEVTIGRVEVRAAQAAPAPKPARTAPRAPAVSLDDYLRARGGGGR
jgi:hypothetical protein